MHWHSFRLYVSVHFCSISFNAIMNGCGNKDARWGWKKTSNDNSLRFAIEKLDNLFVPYTKRKKKTAHFSDEAIFSTVHHWTSPPAPILDPTKFFFALLPCKKLKSFFFLFAELRSIGQFIFALGCARHFHFSWHFFFVILFSSRVFAFLQTW